MNDGEQHSYRARWVIPVGAEPVADATIRIEGDRIVDIHFSNDPSAIDLGPVAVIPGLVNAHTHLEFSDLDDPLQPADPFTDWIRSLMEYRRMRQFAPAENARLGLDESGRSGTTLLGEIATEGWKADAFARHGSEVVVFREFLGLDPGRVDESLALARQHAADAQIRPAISPHAPYSLHPELFDGLIDVARDSQVPLAIHLAETRAELQLLESGDGPFADMLKSFGVWRDDGFVEAQRPMDFLRPLVGLEQALIIHGNYLSDDEIAFLSQHREMTVVYCPRTHDYFGHSEHPWRKMLEQGVSLAIGTDSRASNPDLSLWNELKFLHARFPDVSSETLLRLGTINGARTLDLDDSTGTLEIGKRADLAVVSLDWPDAADPLPHFFSKSNRVIGTMCRGSWIDNNFINAG